MQDNLIKKIASLMSEQSVAFSKLESLTELLIVALTLCEPERIDSIVRAAEAELFKMRSRLLEITSELSAFSEERASQTESQPLDPDARSNFETAAKQLLERARQFAKTAGRADSLALGGLSFATAHIQSCGLPPSTYRAPVLRSGRGMSA
jgi:hypothetical protein